MTSLQKRPSSKHHQVIMFYALKDQLDLIYRQLNHFRVACKSVDRLNRMVRDWLLLDDQSRHQQQDRDGQNLLAEFVQFERNYRVSRRKLRKLDRKLLSVNLYDRLYDLYESLAIGEAFETVEEDLNEDDSSRIEQLEEVSSNMTVENEESRGEDFAAVTTEDSDSEDSIEIQLDPRELDILDVPHSSLDSSSSLPISDADVGNSSEFRCDQCDKTFVTSSSLSDHKRIQHLEEQSFQCTYDGCQYRTTVNWDFLKHINLHKRQRQMFKCDQCDKSFKASSTLASHKLTHESEPQYRCNWDGCQYRSHYKFSLKRHSAVHTGERLFQCDKCGKSYKSSSTLIDHKRIHDTDPQYKCYWSGCGYKTTRKVDLKRHSAVHTGERPFHCDKCQKSFATSSFLSVHMRLHDSESRYRCTYEGCDYRSTRNDRLKKHLSSHTDHQ